MSEVYPGVHIVDGVTIPGAPGAHVNVCLLVDGDGITMVDAGYKGSLREPLQRYVASIGRSLADIRRIVITHHHLDHTGGLPWAVGATGAEVWAHVNDAPYIDGTMPRPEMSPPPPAGPTHGVTPEQAQAILARRAAMEAAPVPVDLTLVGNEELRVLGGCVFVHTPGHTPGHLSLFLPALSLLIAGDTMRFADGVIAGAPEHYNTDTRQLHRSNRALLDLGFERMIPYHGDLCEEHACELARRAFA